MRLAGLALSLVLAGALPAATAAAQSSPVTTHPLAAGEVLLELNATGSVTTRADVARMTVMVNTSGATEAQARAAAEALVRRVTAAARSHGSTAGEIESRPITVSTMTVDTTMEPAPAAPVDGAAVPEAVEPSPAPTSTAYTSIQITARGDRAAALFGELGAIENVSVAQPVYSLASNQVARRAARERALATARADAEAYAASLNLRVGRVVRITERIGLDLIGVVFNDMALVTRAFGSVMNQQAEIETIVIVGVDFALVPR